METDQELVSRVLAGQASAKECLVRRWAPRVLAVCRSKVRSATIAEDLAQEALLRGLSQLDRLADPNRFAAWIRTITTNVCIDWLRVQSCRPGSVSLDAVEFSMPQSAEDSLADAEVCENLVGEVDGLPEELREPILMFYYGDVTYDEIAATLGVSRATVSARLTKARSILAKRLAYVVEGTIDAR